MNCDMLKDLNRLDKTVFSVVSIKEPSGDKEYWLSKTPQERIMALEFMRQTLYGYDPATERLQRVLTVVKP